jgi:glutaminyl-peptide cyclotransferase
VSRRRPNLAYPCIVLLALGVSRNVPVEGEQPCQPPPLRILAEGGYCIAATYPHDPEAWTQGLVWHDGHLIEGTGQEGRSYLKQVDLVTGTVKHEVKLPDRYYGEGIAVAGGQVYQLTWQNRIGFIYDLDTLEPTGSWTIEGDGWGLAFDGHRLLMSDGTAWVRFIDPATMTVADSVQVTDDGRPVTNLNELEIVDDELFANVWPSDSIARIDPGTGEVTGWLDLTGLLPDADRSQVRNVGVLNGIAYDPHSTRLFVTGKHWPKLFEIRLD